MTRALQIKKSQWRRGATIHRLIITRGEIKENEWKKKLILLERVGGGSQAGEMGRKSERKNVLTAFHQDVWGLWFWFFGFFLGGGVHCSRRRELHERSKGNKKGYNSAHFLIWGKTVTGVGGVFS